MAFFTLVHVVISLIGIITGLVVLGRLMSGKRLDGWTGLFLLTTIVTSVTGYGFPVDRVLPSHIVGAISLIALAIAGVARDRYRLAQGWRKLVMFVVLGYRAVVSFREPAAAPARQFL